MEQLLTADCIDNGGATFNDRRLNDTSSHIIIIEAKRLYPDESAISVAGLDAVFGDVSIMVDLVTYAERPNVGRLRQLRADQRLASLLD